MERQQTGRLGPAVDTLNHGAGRISSFQRRWRDRKRAIHRWTVAGRSGSDNGSPCQSGRWLTLSSPALAGSETPVTAAQVAMKSTRQTVSSVMMPGAMVAGQRDQRDAMACVDIRLVAAGKHSWDWPAGRHGLRNRPGGTAVVAGEDEIRIFGNFVAVKRRHHLPTTSSTWRRSRRSRCWCPTCPEIRRSMEIGVWGAGKGNKEEGRSPSACSSIQAMAFR
ncbi:MAG: hypothetical protein R2932_47255 [Caldilineaceae bacterium]